MAKHAGSGHGRRHTPEPVKVIRKAARKPKPPPTVVPAAAPAEPAAPASPSPLEHAARRLLGAASQVAQNVEHGPACPAGGGGPCICGYLELKGAITELHAALEP